MKRIKIKLEIDAEGRSRRRVSSFDKLINAFVRIWKATLASSLRRNSKTILLCLLIVVPTLFYFLFHILPFILYRP